MIKLFLKLNKYGILGTIYIFYCLVRTKFISRNARLIRFPIDIRNLNLINFGSELTTGKYCRIEVERLDTKNEQKLFFGNNVQLNDFVHISASEKIVISDNVLIASKVFISDSSHGSYDGEFQDVPFTNPQLRKLKTSPIFIGKNVWIGEGVTILKGVKIGDNSIIGANSVITRDIPSNVIAVGVPAIIKKIYNNTTKKWEKV